MLAATEETIERLAAIPNLHVRRDEPLAPHTRFGIGGSARIFAETSSAESFVRALETVRAGGAKYAVIGGGTNLIVSDGGFPGIVLRYTADRILQAGERVSVDAGAVLQGLVDFTVDRGLKGLETLAGIPGSAGAAVYGNAGAYGHSISERVRKVRFYDGRDIRIFDHEQCEFHYRESIFKQNKDWLILSAELCLEPADPAELRRIADDIVKVRNQKFPPTMKCAGSIFKNLLLGELPESARGQVPEQVVREGKVPAAYFLEQVGAKGMRHGGIHVADYHANLIYNAGEGTAGELCELIDDLKARVRGRFGLELEEEVQYVGFNEETGERV